MTHSNSDIYIEGIAPLRFGLYLPVIVKRPYWRREAGNDWRNGACGPLEPGMVYHEYISSASDELDCFYFEMPTRHAIEA